MAIAILRSRPPAERPIGPSWVNWGSPQTRGLLAWFPLTGGDGVEQADPICRDALAGILLARNGTWNRSEYQSGLGLMPFVNHFQNSYFTGTVPTQLSTLNPPLSYSMWIVTNSAKTDERALVGGISGAYWRLSNTNRLNFLKSGVTDFGTGTTALTNAVPYHIGVTISAAGGITFYLNGIADGTQSTSGATFTSGSDLTLGSNLGVERNVALISDVRLANVEWSPAEMWALYHSETRWDLYWQPSTRVYTFQTSIASGVDDSKPAARGFNRGMNRGMSA